MELPFVKYSATGNDFIAIDNREQQVEAGDRGLWRRFCTRRRGIGADGVLLLERAERADRANFKMRYLNGDGGEVDMCGNGVRTLAAFAAEELKIEGGGGRGRHLPMAMATATEYTMELRNGHCWAFFDRKKREAGLEMGGGPYNEGPLDIDLIGPYRNQVKEKMYLKAGVPHCLFWVDDVEAIDVVAEGRRLRHHEDFPDGTNSDFFQVISSGVLKIRTYERGVEDETLSCGTGAMAAATMAFRRFHWRERVTLHTRGGILKVLFGRGGAGGEQAAATTASLWGSVETVYKGVISL